MTDNKIRLVLVFMLMTFLWPGDSAATKISVKEAEKKPQPAVEMKDGASGKVEPQKTTASKPEAEWLRRNQELLELVRDKKTEESIRAASGILNYLQEKKMLESQEAATTHNNLGMIYLSLGQYDKSHPHLIKALELRTRLTGPDSIDVATVWLNLSHLYKLQAESIIQRQQKRADEQSGKTTASEKKDSPANAPSEMAKPPKKTQK